MGRGRRGVVPAGVCSTGGKPSTWLPPGRLVEQVLSTGVAQTIVVTAQLAVVVVVMVAVAMSVVVAEIIVVAVAVVVVVPWHW